MRISLQGAYLHFFPDLRSYVERRLAYALVRCKAHVRAATVSLKNRKPARGEVEWRCAIRVKIQGAKMIRVEAGRALPSEAIDDATLRLGDRIARRKVRKGSALRARPESVQAEPQWGGRALNTGPVASRARRHR